MICYPYAAVCGGASGPQVPAPLGTAGNGWICCIDDHCSCLAGMHIIYIYINGQVSVSELLIIYGVIVVVQRFTVYLICWLCCPSLLTGKGSLDVVHKHRGYLWVCGLLWDWTRPHPMVHCGWTVQSRPKTLGFCCRWILQLDRKLYRGHVLSVCGGERPVGINRRILAHLFWLTFWLTFLFSSSTLTGALWAVRVYHLHHISTWLLRLHLLQSPRDQGPDVRWNLGWFPPGSVSCWEEHIWRVWQAGGRLSALKPSSDPAARNYWGEGVTGLLIKHFPLPTAALTS